jgi:3-oxoacyl-[acyl-carrier-protein] synthase III
MAGGEPGRPFLSSISFELGRAVPLDCLDDARVQQFLDQLNADGLTKCLVSDRSSVEGASLCARDSLQTPIGPIEPDLAVLCSDSLAPHTPVGAARSFAEGIGLPNLPVVNVSGGDCGNLGMGLRLACGVLAAEALSNVLLVTSDCADRRGRYLATGLTAMSDGAASCLISARPEGCGFAVLGMASASASENTDSTTPAGALTVVRSVRRITRQVLGRLGITAPDCRYLVVGNYGRATQELFAGATGLPQSALRTPLLTEVAHCYSADLLLSLHTLAERDELKSGDRLVLVSSGTRSWTVIVVEYVA